MNDIKIVFFDIDGTLVKLGEKTLSDKTAYTLRKLREKGIRICIATGRSPSALPELGIAFDAYLTFNGSLCYTESETIHSDPIPSSTVQQLIQNAAAIGRPVSVATRTRLAANGWDQDLSDYYDIAHLTLTVAEDFEEACQEGVYQLMLGSPQTEPPAVIQGVDGVKAVFSWDRAVDVICANSGKGTGIRKILEHFGLSVSQALAFGDSNNDLEMLQTAGTGIAMGNACDQLKAVADGICGTVTDDGIYHYCLEYGLI